MENNKKNQQNFSRPSNAKSQQFNDTTRKELQASKPLPRFSRRREQPITTRNDTQRNNKQYPTAKARPINVDKRPRARAADNYTNGNNFDYDGSCTSDDLSATSAGLASEQSVPVNTGAVSKTHKCEYELNSVYNPGSKKLNLNHLLNFNYTPREAEYPRSFGVFGRGNNNGGNGNFQRKKNNKQKYNKEQFLQANFQFVIKKCDTPNATASPDTLIDWNLIEQINIQTTEDPQCPICLYPPIAAKLTRCGHAYCWPCILHYLALSDKTWRKCPICYEAVHVSDLKSTAIIQQNQVSVGGEITFNLMRRQRGSMFVEKFKTAEQTVENYPLFSDKTDSKLFSKFLIASDTDIFNIVERERHELMQDDDVSCPEYVFVQQALDLLKERHDKINTSKAKKVKRHDDAVVEVFQLNIDDHIDKTENELKLEDVNINKEVTNADKTLSINHEEENNLIITERCSIDEANVSNIVPQVAAISKYYYFYQCEDGQNIFLHPLNIKMLQACYGTLDCAPPFIKAKVLQKEHHSMDDDHRRKFTCLGHLPLTCQFEVVEVDLRPPIVTDNILKEFQDEISQRKKERKRREVEERKREKRINEINDRQIGKLVTTTANLNLESNNEFPICGFDEPLLGSSPTHDNIQHSSTPTSRRQKFPASYSSVTEKHFTMDFPTLKVPSVTYNRYEELSTWGKPNSAVVNAAIERTTENDVKDETDETYVSSSFKTTLSDVLAEAMQKQKQRNIAQDGTAGTTAATTTGGQKKNKKAKKFVPLFTTGINYNGN